MNLIAQRYFSKYGAPCRTADYVSKEGHRIQVFKWSGEKTGEGVNMYATSGASEILGTKLRSCEFFIGLTPAVDDVAEALAEVALHGIGSKAVPSAGDSTTLPFALWSGTQMRSLLFTDGSGIVPSYTDALKRIDFIQLVPVFASELDFKKEHGEPALWEKFELAAVPYWNSNREPAI